MKTDRSLELQAVGPGKMQDAACKTAQCYVSFSGPGKLHVACKWMALGLNSKETHSLPIPQRRWPRGALVSVAGDESAS